MSRTPSPASSPNCDLMSISPTNATNGDAPGDDEDTHSSSAAYVRASLRFEDDEQDEWEHHRSQLGASLSALHKPQEEDDEDDDDDLKLEPTYPSTSMAIVPASAVPSTSTALITVPTAPSVSTGRNSGYSPSSRVRNPYTGLSNQGATCYMNSLLQTMFMTPELRLGLYRWTYGESEDGDDDEDGEDDVPEEDNIPFQLQKLFAKLQLSKMEAISTKALTKSFGWTGADVFQQHDVQELCRVLFDAIEKSCKGTSAETLVNDLYQGSLKDYVKCCTCGYESSRNDNFLDLSLVIHPFGTTHMMKSVDEAIEYFLKPELLSGDNQWMCDRCKTKQDAIKGLKFSKLPYLLSLQLKRFDYDFVTDSRIKLHDRVVFPKYLNMNSYVASEDGHGARGTIARKMSMERHQLEGSATPDARPRRLSSMDESNPIHYVDEDDVNELGGASWDPSFDPIELIDEGGPYVYELYSVLIHSGSALGGHYYAYIKALENGKWYDFNDSTVSEISEVEVKKAWGGNGGTIGSRVSYSTCAYMLMYRMIDREKNVNVIPESSIPPYLIKRMHEEEERIRHLELERIENAKKVQIKFYTKAPDGGKYEKSLHIYRTSNLHEALRDAYNAFSTMEGVMLPSIENVRLRSYNDYTGILTDTYTGKEDLTLQDLNMYSGCQLFLEIKRDADDPWEEYNPAKLQLFIRRFIPEDEQDQQNVTTQWNAQYIHLDEQATVKALCDVIQKIFDVTPGKALRLIKRTASAYTATPVRVLNTSDSSATMRLRYDLHLVSGSDVYFEECDHLSDPSPAQAFFEREANMIEISYNYLNHPQDVVRIDRRETVRTLKNEISSRINLPISKFKLLRGSHVGGIEIKTIDNTLYKMSISNGHSVTVVEGIPLEMGEYMLRLVLYHPKSEQKGTATDERPVIHLKSEDDHDTTETNHSAAYDVNEVQIRLEQEESELVTVGGVVAHEEMPVEELRRRVWAILKEKDMLCDGAATPEYVRLRDVRANTLTKILVDGLKLHQALSTTLYEDKGIVAQLLPKPEHLSASHRMFKVVYLDLTRWRFCKRKRFELFPLQPPVGTDGSEYIPQEIADHLGIDVENLHFYVTPYESGTFNVCEMYRVSFAPWTECMMMLRARGVELDTYQMVVFAVDTSVPVAPFPDDERREIQDFLVKKREEESRAERAKYSSSWTYHKPREAALVIRTKSKSTEKGHKSDGTSHGSTPSNGAKATPTRRNTGARSGANRSDTDEEEAEFGKRDLFDMDMDLYD